MVASMEPKPLRELLEARKEYESSVGSSIRAARLSRGLSQTQVAQGMGVSNSYVSNVEKGHKTPSATVAEAFLIAIEKGAQHGNTKQSKAADDVKKARD